MKLPTFSGHSSWINFRSACACSLGSGSRSRYRPSTCTRLRRRFRATVLADGSGTLVWYRGKGQWVRIMVGSSGRGHCGTNCAMLPSVSTNVLARSFVPEGQGCETGLADCITRVARHRVLATSQGRNLELKFWNSSEAQRNLCGLTTAHAISVQLKTRLVREQDAGRANAISAHNGTRP